VSVGFVDYDRLRTTATAIDVTEDVGDGIDAAMRAADVAQKLNDAADVAKALKKISKLETVILETGDVLALRYPDFGGGGFHRSHSRFACPAPGRRPTLKDHRDRRRSCAAADVLAGLDRSAETLSANACDRDDARKGVARQSQSRIPEYARSRVGRKGIADDCKADPNALLFAVVDKHVRRIATSAQH
jgi:hypothetical protein